MTYAKPEVTLLGAAIKAVQGDKDGLPIDSSVPSRTAAAYQADE